MKPSTHASSNHVATPPRAKRKCLELEPSSLSEQEQIALAIGNSLREINSNGGNRSEHSYGEDDDDNDDENSDAFDPSSDDEFSNQSYKSNTLSSKDQQVTSAVDDKRDNEEEEQKVVTNTPESYESHLGDESGE